MLTIHAPTPVIPPEFYLPQASLDRDQRDAATLVAAIPASDWLTLLLTPEADLPRAVERLQPHLDGRAHRLVLEYLAGMRRPIAD